MLFYPKGLFLGISVYACHKWKAAGFQAAVSNQTAPNVTTLSKRTFHLPFAQGHVEETPDVLKSALGTFITKAQNKMLVDCAQKYMAARKIFLSQIFLRWTLITRPLSQNRMSSPWLPEQNNSQVNPPKGYRMLRQQIFHSFITAVCKKWMKIALLEKMSL